MKYISYGRQCIDKNDIEAVSAVLRSGWITQGPKVRQFEKSLCKYTGAKYCVAVSSGTAALHLACIVAGLTNKHEAITSPITFLATANAIIYTGAKPVFADIDPVTVNISPYEIEKYINTRTRVILPVHFAGLPCDMETIHKIAKKKHLIIIEDACHALGAEYKSKGAWHKVGSCNYSDICVFSFHPVKSITTGEGGAITTNNKMLYSRLCALRTHGVYKEKSVMKKNGPWHYQMKELGFNYRITDMQAALGISQLKKLSSFIRRRREIAGLYKKLLSGLGAIDLPAEPQNYHSAWHLFYIRFKDYKKRRKVFEKLRRNGVFAQVHYIPLYMQPYYADRFGYDPAHFNKANTYYKSTISLPIYPGLKRPDISRVARIIKDSL